MITQDVIIFILVVPAKGLAITAFIALMATVVKVVTHRNHGEKPQQ